MCLGGYCRDSTIGGYRRAGVAGYGCGLGGADLPCCVDLACLAPLSRVIRSFQRDSAAERSAIAKTKCSINSQHVVGKISSTTRAKETALKFQTFCRLNLTTKKHLELGVANGLLSEATVPGTVRGTLTCLMISVCHIVWRV